MVLFVRCCVVHRFDYYLRVMDLCVWYSATAGYQCQTIRLALRKFLTSLLPSDAFPQLSESIFHQFERSWTRVAHFLASRFHVWGRELGIVECGEKFTICVYARVVEP